MYNKVINIVLTNLKIKINEFNTFKLFIEYQST